MVNYLKLNACILFVPVLLMNCSKTNSDEGKTLVGIGHVVPVNLDERYELSEKNHLDSLRLIRLETNKECLIGGIDKIEIIEDRIYILDKFKSKSLFCFDLKGQFLFKIHHLGKGPGEFILPEEFTVSQNQISIYDNFRKLKINYDINGNFIDETKMIVSIRNVVQLDSGFALVKPDQSYLGSENDYNLLVTDSEIGKVLKRYIPGVTKGESIFSVNKAFARNGDHYLFTYGFNDTIYTYENNSLKSLFVVDFGKNKIPHELAKSSGDEIQEAFFNSDQNYIGYLTDISENDDYITCRYSKFSIRGENNFILYSKENNKIYNFSNIYYHKDKFRIYPPKFVYNNKFVSIVAYNFENESSSNLLPSGMDNPAIALYSIRRGL